MDRFLTLLNQAKDIARQYDKSAQFLKAFHDQKLLGAPWIFTFVTPKGAVELKYMGTGFAPPQPVPILLGLETIPLLIDFTEAEKALPVAWTTFILDCVLYPNAHPQYIFTGQDGNTYFVNAYTGELKIGKPATMVTPVETPTNIPVDVR